MSAYSTPLTPATIQPAFQLLTGVLLGLVPQGTPVSDVPTSVYNAVRVEWQTLGQPAWKTSDDVTFVRCLEIDDQYNRQRDKAEFIGSGSPPTTVSEVTSYVRVWECAWEIYGPNSFDNARKIRSGVFTQAVHDTFATLGLRLYLVTDPAAPRRVPFLSDSKWWERVDFEARFNELVQEPVTVGLGATVEVVVYDAAASIAGQPLNDLVITLPTESEPNPPYVPPAQFMPYSLHRPLEAPDGVRTAFDFSGIPAGGAGSVAVYANGSMIGAPGEILVTVGVNTTTVSFLEYAPSPGWVIVAYF